LEGLDEIPTVTHLGLPAELRRSLACTSIIEIMMGTIHRVCRKCQTLAGRLHGAALDQCRKFEAAKGFRRLKAYKQFAGLRTALAAHQTKHAVNSIVELAAKAA
jgi:hypothetical protein